MELTYRGRSYIATPSTVKTQESDAEGVFLGAHFKLKQAKAVHRHHQPVLLTYRMVKYIR